MLTGVRVERIGPGAITLRLIAPDMGDAFVQLRRGERMLRIQHGDGTLEMDRSVSLAGAGAGTVTPGRVEELSAYNGDLRRFVASIDDVTEDAGTFTLTAQDSTVARMAAGVATDELGDSASAMHGQLGDASRFLLCVEDEPLP